MDRFAFEVITEAEVAQHFEERVVVSGASDVVDVAGAKAFLARCGAGEVELDLPQEVILELVHSGGSEQDGRVPGGDQHITSLSHAAFGFEERQVLFS